MENANYEASHYAFSFHPYVTFCTLVSYILLSTLLISNTFSLFSSNRAGNQFFTDTKRYNFIHFNIYMLVFMMHKLRLIFYIE